MALLNSRDRRGTVRTLLHGGSCKVLRACTAEGESGGKAESEWCDSRQQPYQVAHPCSHAATQLGSLVDKFISAIWMLGGEE